MDKKMNKQEFSNKYKFGNSPVIDPKCNLFFACAISDALVEFLNDQFTGAIEVSASVKTSRHILICPEYMAMFFKRLLTDIYGRVYLKVLIESDQKYMTITISSDSPLPLSYEEMSLLIKTARNAGMEIYPTESEILLVIDFSSTARHYVYAPSADSKLRMISKLNEIFFCGEPMKIDNE